MKTFRFLEFKVYKDAKIFYQRMLILSKDLNNYSFKDQINRAALSVVLNIAEGSARKSDKEFARFLEISIASLNEVVACIDIMHDVKKINYQNYKNLLNKSEELAKQLGGFIKKLKINN